MRDSSGGPNWRVRVIAIVVAALVAGPVVVAVAFQGLSAFFRAVL